MILLLLWLFLLIALVALGAHLQWVWGWLFRLEMWVIKHWGEVDDLDKRNL